MRPRRNLALWVIGLAAVGAASAQSSTSLRWRSGAAPLGLQAGASNELRTSCGPTSPSLLACDATASVPLYSSPQAPRSLSLQLGFDKGSAALDRSGFAQRTDTPQGLSFNLVGKAGILPDLGVYGRIGSRVGRSPGLALAGPDGSTNGLSYGVGLSWDFSRRASAVLGFDSYDVRGAAGESRDVRATSLGLQWRY
jgi:hypothetical protein